jgi:hypothetical protein
MPVDARWVAVAILTEKRARPYSERAPGATPVRRFDDEMRRSYFSYPYALEDRSQPMYYMQ